MVVPSSPGLIITGPGSETAAAIIITDKCKSVRTGSTVCARLSYLLDDTINCQHNGQSRCVCVCVQCFPKLGLECSSGFGTSPDKAERVQATVAKAFERADVLGLAKWLVEPYASWLSAKQEGSECATRCTQAVTTSKNWLTILPPYPQPQPKPPREYNVSNFINNCFAHCSQYSQCLILTFTRRLRKRASM